MQSSIVRGGSRGRGALRGSRTTHARPLTARWGRGGWGSTPVRPRREQRQTDGNREVLGPGSGGGHLAGRWRHRQTWREIEAWGNSGAVERGFVAGAVAADARSWNSIWYRWDTQSRSSTGRRLDLEQTLEWAATLREGTLAGGGGKARWPAAEGKGRAGRRWEGALAGGGKAHWPQRGRRDGRRQ
jgi:hypothetical protein